MRLGSTRQSNFELLRLLSMFFIVFYHLLLRFHHVNDSFGWMQALWLPLHVGVVCFVLISGYFGIRTSSRGLLLYLSFLFVYSLPDIVFGIKDSQSVHDIFHSLMFVSRTKYWFALTYLGLYLVAPLMNRFFQNSSIREQWYLLAVFALISIYLGNFARSRTYFEGKNLVNFLFIYQIGHLLIVYAPKWQAFDKRKLVCCYLALNAVLVSSYLLFNSKWLGDVIWRLSFPYNSPVLIVNAVLLFMIIGQLEFHSLFVNRMAEGCFAIYLIHSSSPLIEFFQRPVIDKLFAVSHGNSFLFILFLFVFAIVIMVCCIAINTCMNESYLEKSISLGWHITGENRFLSFTK